MTTITKSLNPAYIVAMQKLVQAFSGLGTALMVTHFLSPAEQGYYYTFGSLLSSYIIFDLGLSTYILQKSAQLSSAVTIDANGKIHPQGEKRNYFVAFTQWTIRLYSYAGVATFFILGPLGLLILSQNDNQNNFNYTIAWLLITATISISMPTIGFFAILEGAGKLTETYSLRIGQYFFGTLFAWLLIASGNSLFAQAMPFIAAIVLCYVCFHLKYKKNFYISIMNSNYSFNSLVLPNSKYTASILSSNYIFLNAPILIAYAHGHVETAGQLGLAIIIANVGGAIAMSSTTSQMPEIIKLIANDSKKKAYVIYRNNCLYFASLFIFGTIFLLTLSYTFKDHWFFTRLPNALNLIYIFLAIGFYHASNSCISYLRAMQINNPSLFSLSTLLIFPLSNTLGTHYTDNAGLVMCLSISPLFIICVYFLRKSSNQLNLN